MGPNAVQRPKPGKARSNARIVTAMETAGSGADDKVCLLVVFDQIKFVFWLFIFLLIFANSADFDGCKELINRKVKNISFFEILEINLKFN